MLEAKYTDIQATLTAARVGADTVHARPRADSGDRLHRPRLPRAQHLDHRGFSAFKLPHGRCASDDYGGKYYDFDLYGTVNFTDDFGAQAGLPLVRRVLQGEAGLGDDEAEGSHVGGVVRFLDTRQPVTRRARSIPRKRVSLLRPSISVRAEAGLESGRAARRCGVAGWSGTSTRRSSPGPNPTSPRQLPDSEQDVVRGGAVGASA